MAEYSKGDKFESYDKSYGYEILHRIKKVIEKDNGKTNYKLVVVDSGETKKVSEDELSSDYEEC